ncbi:MAG TPA: hypothetical protein P5304_25245 [Phycisphaerae bacterium]|nr:hypothetical protein [Phycisphaerae bacterium]
MVVIERDRDVPQKEEARVYTYVVDFQFRGRSYRESVTCYGSGGAVALIQARYPGARIYGVRYVGHAGS